MTKDKFREILEVALEVATSDAEKRLQRKLSRNFQVLLHGAGHSGDLLDIHAATDELYLGEDIFYRIIDVAVIEVSSQSTTIFVRASSHTPGSFEQTWNDPPGSGPFKQLAAQKITIVDE